MNQIEKNQRLIEAAGTGDLDEIRHLVNRGAQVDAQDNQALRNACSCPSSGWSSLVVSTVNKERLRLEVSQFIAS